MGSTKRAKLRDKGASPCGKYSALP